MKIKWEDLLRSNGVPYVTTGANVARGHVNVRCPFCGPADPSHHMGIRLEDGAWGCYRDPGHRGRSATRLLVALLRCSVEDARKLTTSDALVTDMGKLTEKLRALDSSSKQAPAEEVSWPSEFRRFEDGPGKYEKPLHQYLVRRGFDFPFNLADRYDFRWALGGRWDKRIILPLDDGFSMVGWTGRHIGDASIRYLTSGPVGDMLFNARDVLQGGRVLVIVEGPFDALKLDYYGAKHGVRSIALLGLTVARAKMQRVLACMDRYEQTYYMLDAGAERTKIELGSILGPRGARPLDVPYGKKDPGELDKQEVLDLVAALTGRKVILAKHARRDYERKASPRRPDEA
jgi:hypothetical protein